MEDGGGSKHRNNEEKKRFVYYKKWEDAEQLYLKLGGDKIDIGPLLQDVSSIHVNISANGQKIMLRKCLTT